MKKILVLPLLSNCNHRIIDHFQGTRLRKLPHVFRTYQKVLLGTWEHDPAPLPTAHLLLAANEALLHSSILIQGIGETVKVPFPYESNHEWASHPVLKNLAEKVST